jgi:hypothetical protein
MKSLSCLIIVAMLAFAATPSFALCVSEMDIRETTPSKDGKELTFKMRDGRVLVNHLRGICRDMIFTGYSWVLHGSHDVCENQTVLQVLQSGQTCILGRFAPAPTPLQSR